MRVIAGQARRLRLIVPEGNDVRPTTDRTKETIFNIINPYIYNSVFLDLFSGSGSIGIEALSRGAKEAYFVENNVKALRCIEENLNHTKLSTNAHVLKYDFSRALSVLNDGSLQFDIIFLDPPYDKGLEEKAISQIFNYNLLKKDGLIICESSFATNFDFIDEMEDYNVEKTKEYKTSKFTFINKV